MNTHVAPSIASVGPPPTRHAERVVDAMLVWLHGRQAEVFARARGSFKSSQMGNPVGQERAVARLRKALGEMALGLYLSPAKRGKYRLTLVQWMIWNTTKDELTAPEEPCPASAQLAIVVSFRSALSRHEWEPTIPMLVTRHAIVRLAERADVRTVGDLIEALRQLWLVLYDLLMRDVLDGVIAGDKGRWCNPPPEGWRVRMDSGPIAVIGRDENSNRLLVKTILDGDCA